MTRDHSPNRAPRGPVARSSRLVLLVLICAMVGVELVMLAADSGIVGSSRLRRWTYENGGFWPGLLRDWRPNYAIQPATMFVTYGFLHAGIAHLAVNMVTLWSLGSAILDRAGPGVFLLLYGAGLLGGGLGYGLLGGGYQPMVGASGALFGLAGTLLAWNLADRTIAGADRLPVAYMAGLLVAMNLVMFWALDGQLAWEAHLGGFLAGALAGRVVLGRGWISTPPPPEAAP